MMVSDPPSSMLRAAPKNRLGFCSALASTPPERILPLCGTLGVVGPGQSRDRVEQDDDVRPYSTRRLAFSMTMSRHLHVPRCRFVERRADDLGFVCRHVGDFFRSLVDEQDDDIGFGMVGRDGVGHFLEQDCLTGARWGDDEHTLAHADGRRRDLDDARATDRSRSWTEPTDSARKLSLERSGQCPPPPPVCRNWLDSVELGSREGPPGTSHRAKSLGPME
jgi:hypothetical protein